MTGAASPNFNELATGGVLNSLKFARTAAAPR